MSLPNKEFPRQLRQLADFLEAHPELEHPEWPRHVCVSYTGGVEAMIAAAKMPGAVKEYDSTFLNVYVEIAPDLPKLNYFIARNVVCEPVETVESVIPAQPEHTVKTVTKWKCHPLLGIDKLEKDTESVPNAEVGF